MKVGLYLNNFELTIDFQIKIHINISVFRLACSVCYCWMGPAAVHIQPADIQI